MNKHWAVMLRLPKDKQEAIGIIQTAVFKVLSKADNPYMESLCVNVYWNDEVGRRVFVTVMEATSDEAGS